MSLTYPSQSSRSRGVLVPRPSPRSTWAHGCGVVGGDKKRRPEEAVLGIARGLCSGAAAKLNARNGEGDTFLQVACKVGYSKVVDYLLEHGPPRLDIDARHEGGFNALAYASRGFFLDIVVKLVAAGAETDLFEVRWRARSREQRRCRRATEEPS
jgi:ankyrin repeat protein